MTHSLVFLGQLLKSGIGRISVVGIQESLELLNYLALMREVDMLLIALSFGGCIACLEEMVACSKEIRPQHVALFLGHNTDGFPLLLECDKLI